MPTQIAGEQVEEVATLEGMRKRGGLGSTQLGGFFGKTVVVGPDQWPELGSDFYEGDVGGWVNIRKVNATQLSVTIPRWYSHPYVIGGAVGLVAGYLLSKVI